MKYPAEVSTLPYGPEREEALVRRCAQVCPAALLSLESRHGKGGEFWDGYRAACIQIERQINADFGLTDAAPAGEPKP